MRLGAAARLDGDHRGPGNDSLSRERRCVREWRPIPDVHPHRTRRLESITRLRSDQPGRHEGAGISPASIDTVIVSHLHGDHFGGLPFLLLDAQFNSRRTKPLALVGHGDLQPRLRAAMEALFPGLVRALELCCPPQRDLAGAQRRFQASSDWILTHDNAHLRPCAHLDAGVLAVSREGPGTGLPAGGSRSSDGAKS
jgi:hypothetical protein